MDTPKLLHLAAGALALLCFIPCAVAQPRYDLILRGGHVIDAKNKISAVRDVAILNGRIAAVAAHLDPATAVKTVDVSGLYVTPGLVDIHVHVYAGTGERDSYAGDNSVYPDGFTFRVGVTTVADAGCSGWRNFEDFKERIIDRSQTRVLAFLNIVGAGMRGPKFENNLADMEAAPAADMALKHKDLIVGIKTAHYAGPGWTPVEHAVEAGTKAEIPVMVDFGDNRPERPSSDLLTKKLRPGDIYTHCYSGLRHELDDAGHSQSGHDRGTQARRDLRRGPRRRQLRVARRRSGHQAGFPSRFHLHRPAHRQHELRHEGHAERDEQIPGAGPVARRRDSALHLEPRQRNPSRGAGQPSVGAPADVAVLRLETGSFGFTDMYGARLDGNQKLICELTVRNGKVVYDLNGITRPEWTTLPKDYTQYRRSAAGTPSAPPPEPGNRAVRFAPKGHCRWRSGGPHHAAMSVDRGHARYPPPDPYIRNPRL